MPEWKVSFEAVDIIPHPEADSLDIAIVDFQSLVVRKGTMQNGDIVLFAPKRSILPEAIRGDYLRPSGDSYLRKGSIVSSVRIRNEISEGVTINTDWALNILAQAGDHRTPVELIGEDISAMLGITEYVAPIPAQMNGEVQHITRLDHPTHDVESMKSMYRYFAPGEMVVVSEKIHGTQGHFMAAPDGTRSTTSKGLAKRNQTLVESPNNLYWQALRGDQRFDTIVDTYFPGQQVNLFVEVFPVQPGYTYGASTTGTPQWRAFSLEVDGTFIDVDTVAERYPLLHDMWTPYDIIPYDLDTIKSMAKGQEQVSGHALHIKEGVVVTPLRMRTIRPNSKTKLFMKVINPKYKGETDDDAMS